MQINTLFGSFFILLSLLFFLLGIVVRTGKYKGWWLVETTQFGILFTLIPTTPELLRTTMRFVIIIVPMMIIILVLATQQPSWLKPAWLNWLEENHQDIMPMLRAEVQKSDSSKWQQQVRTQEGLEVWVAEVCKNIT